MTIARSPLLPIQTAMYDRMVADPDLTGKVFDHVPEAQQKPYVTLGEAIATPRNNHGQFGQETVETLHIWSEQHGMTEALELEDILIELFDHQPLTVAGHRTVSVRFEFSQTLRDPDPNIRHVILRFRVTTEQQAADES